MTPKAVTTYTLVCTGPGGLDARQVTFAIAGSTGGCTLASGSEGGLTSEAGLLFLAVAGAFFFDRRRRARAGA